MPKKSNNPSDTISLKIDFIMEDVKKINLALWGSDGRSGLVKDVAELKSQGSTAILILKSVVVPIIVAVVTAVIISGIPR
jgi:hypothetical protein